MINPSQIMDPCSSNKKTRKNHRDNKLNNEFSESRRTIYTATSTTNESPYHYAPRFGQPISLGSTISPEDYRKRKVALITGYEVHGLIRRSSSFNTGRIEHLYKDVHERPKMVLHYGDLTDTTNLVYIISQTQPTEVYNLAAQSHVKVSFDMAEYTGDVDGLGTLRLLDAIRTCGLTKHVRFYQASTSELYGKVIETPQTENTPFYPRSPYGVAKLYAPKKRKNFVTRKISRAVAEISLGQQECLYLGNLSAKRDWGHAKDYVEGMWKMLQQDQPDDLYLLLVKLIQFVEKAFAVVNIKIKWQGELDSVNETGINGETPMYFRPAEVELLHGLPTKAETQLGWKRTVDFDSLIREMVEADLIGARAADRN
ncbi:hypothetical protein H4Q26_010724 [Puccinia striiformis f. sp. tritici PST-130]|nr:hypothetical protein H4Q26_010724 [Puccinia striiformis f. sp. tritici PST-130]